jgi:hypothetical protein
MPRTIPGLLVVRMAAACSASRTPTTPSSSSPPAADVVNLAGTWSGTLESSNFPAQTVTLTVVQSGNCVDGGWTTATADWTGAISGYAAADSFSGQFSFERATDGGGKCTAAGPIAGQAGAGSLRWTSNDLSPVGSCTGDVPSMVVLTLQRTGS